MGRKKSYDRHELVGAAMEIFRDRGFAGTSSQMLVDGLGVNRFSLYSEFGNKQGLFEASLELYNSVVVERNFGPLEGPTSGLKEIRALMMFLAASGSGPAAGRGCLFCNTAVEFGSKDPTGKKFVENYFLRMSSAFHNSLENACRTGEISDSTSIKRESDYLTTTTIGLFILIRAKAPIDTITNAAEVAVRHLESLSE